MLRESTQHLSGELDYVVTRPIRVQYTPKPGDIRDLPVGHVLPGDIAEAWPNRALNNLIWVGKLVPVPRASQAGTGDAPAPPEPEPPTVEDDASKPFELVKLPGGYYQLSDGSKMRGKNKALAAQAAIAAAPAEPLEA